MFVPADAILDGTNSVVTSAAVAQPVTVRHAWEPNPKVNVGGETGLPLLPFRTDHWPVPGEEWMPRRLPVKRTLATVTLDGDAIAAPSEPSSYVRVGKSTTTGEWVASLHHVAIDAGGAFSP